MDEMLLTALRAIDPATTSYEEWVQIGMALHKEGFGVDVWAGWSAQDASRYHPGECERKWATFGKTNEGAVGGGTIVELAKQRGTDIYNDLEPLDWDSEISDDWMPYQRSDGKIISDKAWLDIEADENQLHEPTDGWNKTGSIDELIRYIRLLYKPDDNVTFVYRARQDDDGKWKPVDHGVCFKAETLIENLERAKKDGDITRAIFSYSKEAGAWIRPNPMNGEGFGDKNVAAFRYALIESDAVGIEQQIAMIRELQLPVRVLVYSGGKSVHAIVRVDARDKNEYKRRVDRIYAECKKNDFIIDEQNKNASRLSRMPGVWRGKQKQYIIAENIGQPSWQAWEDFLEGAKDTLPEIEDLNAALDAPHDLTPELIEGTLRQGHKMLIAGPSKAGKSFLLMELAVAIASGGKWLGKQCKRGKVLYINLEIDKNSFLTRFEEIFAAQEVNRQEAEEIQIWNLRGKTPPLNELAPMLIRRIRDDNLAAIILDPIYKVITGDENNARDMSIFCNQFDRIATETGASVIYVHHHSKGSQAGKRSMDRASGSGVFARDPDALLDMVELAHEADDGDRTAWRMEATLREFKQWLPVNIWFDFPVHSIDEDGDLKRRDIYDSLSQINEKKIEQKEGAKEDAVHAFEDLLEWEGSDTVRICDIAAKIGKTERTVKAYFKEMRDDFVIVSGGSGAGDKSAVKRRTR